MSAVQSKPRDATAEERRHWADRELLEWIAERQEEQMAALDDLRASIAALQSAESAESAELASLTSALQAAEATLAQLQSQVSSGTGVTEADLESLASTVNQVAQAAQAATATATGAAPAGAPVGGSTGPLPPSGGGAAPTQERTVYTFDGDPTTIDATVWPTAPVLTNDSPPRQLYFYAGDTAPGQANGDGVGGVWHAYTGPTQPVPQPAASGTTAAPAGAAAEQVAGADASESTSTEA